MRVPVICSLLSLAACAQGSKPGVDDDASDTVDSDADSVDDAVVIDGNPLLIDGGGGPPDGAFGVTGWQEVAPPLLAGSNVVIPALAIDGAGKAVVAYLTGGGSDEISIEVQRAVAGTWTRIGDLLPTIDYVTLPALATAPGGELWLTWPYGDRYQVRHWDGASWSPPAGTPLGQYTTFLPHTSVVIGPDGEPWVAFDEHIAPSNNEQVYVRSRAAAGAWTDRGSTLGQVNALAPYLASRGDDVCLTYQASGVYAMCWNGSSFVQVGGAIVPAGASSASTSSIALDAGGAPVVAFHAYKDNIDGVIGYVARWTGAAWQFLGQSLQASPGQYMGSPTSAQMQAVAVDDDGNAYVAWTEQDNTGAYGVYVYRCAAGGGGCAAVGRGRLRVSANPEAARLQIDHAGRPVVIWSESTGSQRTVYVWRYLGDPDA